MVLRNQAKFMPSCMCSCLWYKDSEATPEPCFALLPYNHVNSVMVYAALRLCILSIQQYLSIYLYVNLSIYLSTYLVSAYIYIYIKIHTYVCVYIYIYIHVGRERERETERISGLRAVNMHVCTAFLLPLNSLAHSCLLLCL